MRGNQGNSANGGQSRHAGDRKRGSLSLNAFAKAKKSTYDPREVKEKERLVAARTVNKYKKLKARLQGGGSGANTTPLGGGEQPDDEAPQASRHVHEERNAEGQRGRDSHRRPGGPSAAARRSKKDGQPEDDAAQAAAAAAASAKEQRAAAEKQRKTQHKMFQKKTRHGQPVMKYRVEKLLSKIQGDLQP